MKLTTTAQGLIRGGIDLLKYLAVGAQGDQKVSKFLPDFATLAAEGRLWRVQESSAVASVQALPSTTCDLVLGNNEPDDGNWYVLVAVTAFNAANAAAALDAFSVAGCVSQLPAVTGGLSSTLAQDQAKTTIKSMCGVRGGTYNGRAIIDQGLAATLVDDDWFPITPSSGSTAVNAGKGITVWHWMNGIIILPPKTLLALAGLSTSASNTLRKGLVWAEVPKSYLLA